MYDAERLAELIDDYMYECEGRATKRGLAQKLCISTGTVYNVLKGTYNGYAYGKVPHCNRAIDNADFCLVRSVFNG